MTSEDRKRLDEAEFEAFLKGDGELARQLRGLPQPAPSAALDAAILAQTDALLKAEAPAQQAANDALTGKPRKPRKPGTSARPRFMMRWSTQLGMAACMVLAVLATLRWQTEPAPQSYETTPQAEPAAQPAAPVAAVPAPITAPPPAETEAQAKSELSRPKAIARKAAPVAKAAPEAKSPAPEGQQDMQAASAYAPTPPASSPAPARQDYSGLTSKFAVEENFSSRERAIAATPAPIVAAPAPVAPAPSYAPAPSLAPGAVATTLPAQSKLASVAAPQEKPESSARAEAWLSAIDEMLKAGLRQDALEEWEKFKHAHPNYPVPDKLSAQIRQLQK